MAIVRTNAGRKAEDEGEGEAHRGPPGVGLGAQPGAAAEGRRPGGERFGRRCAPALGGFKGAGRRPQLLHTGAVGGRAQRCPGCPAKADDTGRQGELFPEGVGSPLGHPKDGQVRVENCWRGG